MTLHKDLTGADLHEPKGVTSATLGMVYIADGAGSGVWKKLGKDELNTANLPGLLQFVEGFTHPNINSTKTAYGVQARAGSLSRLYGIVDAAVTSDTTLNVLKNGSISIASIIVPAASAAGYTFNFTLSAPLSFAAGDFITVNSNGTGSAVCIASLKLLFNYP